MQTEDVMEFVRQGSLTMFVRLKATLCTFFSRKITASKSFYDSLTCSGEDDTPAIDKMPPAGLA